MVTTYPLLAGFGITAGEGMPATMDSKVKEKWLWKTYGEGVRDALKSQPQRVVRMIHRFHRTAQGDILDAWKDYPGFPATFDFSFKYSVAHMYSIPNPPFIQPLLAGIAPGLRTWLTVRNDDIYSFRWGDPDYARDYIANMPAADKCAGFYMGPDGYIWGRDVPRAPAARGRAAPARHRQAVVQLHALGPARLRSHAARRALRAHPRRAVSRRAGGHASSPPRSAASGSCPLITASSGATST